MALKDKAMLVSLSISNWSGRKYDHNVSQEAIRNNQASDDAGRFNKLLIASDELKAVHTAAQVARQHFYTNTSPWGQNGSNLLSSLNYFNFMNIVRQDEVNYWAAVKAFIPVYGMLVRDSKFRLGRMYNQDDYPPPNRIEKKFGFDLAVFPLPDDGDWRITLNDVETQRIQQDIRTRMIKAQEIAMRDLWGRLYEAVSSMATKLENYTGDRKGAFRDSLIDNMKSLVELLPKMNIADDVTFNAMTKIVEAKLTAYTAQDLRDNESARNNVIQQAKTLLDDMIGFIGD